MKLLKEIFVFFGGFTLVTITFIFALHTFIIVHGKVAGILSTIVCLVMMPLLVSWLIAILEGEDE